jgi:hypothetical protein
LDGLFPGVHRLKAQQLFKALMNEAKPVVAYLQQSDSEVDPDAVKRVIRSFVGSKRREGCLPRAYRHVLRESLAELLPSGLTGSRLAEAIHEARVVHGYRVADIALHLRVHRATISKIFRSARDSRSRSRR